ncbi:hypothetical protein V8D89_002175 [Ganoderma adspersum]
MDASSPSNSFTRHSRGEMFFSHLTALVPLSLSLGRFAAVRGDVPPTVQLDQAIVYGTTNVNSSVTSYLNIPFAEPPIGDLRLRLPKPIDHYAGSINATQVGAQCIQLVPPFREDMPAEMLRDIIAAQGDLSSDPRPQSEDCLNLNVLVPAGTAPDAKLPIIVFIFGGAFSLGSNTQFDGKVMVQRSVEMGRPIISVALNYRLHAFGFLGGKEVKDAGIGNIGLHDCLRWVNKYIGAFGGDPDKVTIWGPSAGGLSVGSPLVANGGDKDGLFRAAVLSCGSLLPTGDISNQQPFFDSIAADAGCADSADKLECLRGILAENLTATAAAIPSFFGYRGLIWCCVVSGPVCSAVVPPCRTFLREPVHEVLAGRIADVPFIADDSLDQGTIFASGAWNITTDEQFLNYMRDFHAGRPGEVEVAPLLKLYPNDPAQGSPFGTGEENQLAPMYKRMAAFQGDFLFQSQRRSLLTLILRSGEQSAWTYMIERSPFAGVGFPHGDDVLSLSRGEDFPGLDYVVQFVATMDPNGGSNRTIPWPRYDSAARKMVLVLDGKERLAIGRDDAL